MWYNKRNAQVKKMGYKRGSNREQYTMLPRSLEESIALENPVRVVDAFVDSLSLEAIGACRIQPAHTGRPPYDARDMFKLYIYGRMNRIRSSRRLQTECGRNIEAMWLINGLEPDFRTIADFRKDNCAAIKAVFRAFVKTCDELALLGKELYSLDGTKIRASNSIKKSFTADLLQKKLAYLQEQEAALDRYLSDMDVEDARETTVRLDVSKEAAPEKLRQVRERAAKYRGYQKRMEETGETHILETDPDCGTLHSKDGLHPAYNIQTAVDEKHHLITEFMTTNHNTDQGLLLPMAEQMKETLGMDRIHFVADKGYESREDIEKCLLNGVIPDVGFKYDKEARYHVMDYEPADITAAEKASTKPEDIQKCLHAGVLPACYEGSNIQVEVQRLEVESCFLRDEDGRVTCPMGRELFKLRERKNGTIYGSAEACRTCPCRCTQSKGKKTVSFGPNTVYVPVIMYGAGEHPVQQIPNIEQSTPYHAYRRRKWKDARVMVTIRRDLALQQKRKEMAEHPFGTVKWYDGAHYFLCRGKEKVTAEMALSFLSYNLRRVINIIGVPGILVHFCRK